MKYAASALMLALFVACVYFGLIGGIVQVIHGLKPTSAMDIAVGIVRVLVSLPLMKMSFGLSIMALVAIK